MKCEDIYISPTFNKPSFMKKLIRFFKRRNKYKELKSDIERLEKKCVSKTTGYCFTIDWSGGSAGIISLEDRIEVLEEENRLLRDYLKLTIEQVNEHKKIKKKK